MKVITIVNSHPGSGQTTVTVNLATGLRARGHRVLIVDWGNNRKLLQWLGTVPLQMSQDYQAPIAPITPTSLGVDILSFAGVEKGQSVADVLAPLMEGLDYEYLLIHPASIEHVKQLIDLPFQLAVCTDLEHLDELALIQTLQQSLSSTDDEPKPVDLIISNKINTKEWDHNSQQLFALGDYFGYETLADPIPHCERIHDLPLTGRTAWELPQENLKSAFTRLVETVEAL